MNSIHRLLNYFCENVFFSAIISLKRTHIQISIMYNLLYIYHSRRIQLLLSCLKVLIILIITNNVLFIMGSKQF